MEQKIKALIKEFHVLPSKEARYEKVIELGKNLPPLYPSDRTPENLVAGCQSELFLKASFDGEKLYFNAHSDALISRGLAAILMHVYNDVTPETLLKVPPDFLKDLGFLSSLTPSRSSGLYSIHLRMKQEALKYLL